MKGYSRVLRPDAPDDARSLLYRHMGGTNPSPRSLKRYASALGVSVDAITDPVPLSADERELNDISERRWPHEVVA